MSHALSPRARKIVVGVVVGLVVGTAAALVALSRPEWAERAEFWTYDYRARAVARREMASKEVVLVDIADQDLRDLEEQSGFGWPWPRSFLARIACYALDSGAKAVAMDFIFEDLRYQDGTMLADDLSEFARILKPCRDRVVVGMRMLKAKLTEDVKKSEARWALLVGDFPSAAAARESAAVLARRGVRVFTKPLDGSGATALFAGVWRDEEDAEARWNGLLGNEDTRDVLVGHRSAQTEKGPSPGLRLMKLSDADLSRELTAEAVIVERALPMTLPDEVGLRDLVLEPPILPIATEALMGNVMQAAEVDGYVRRYELVSRSAGRLFPSLVLATYLAGHPNERPAFEGREIVIGDRRVPLDADGRVGIRYVPLGNAYQRVGAFNVLAAIREREEGASPQVPPSFFAGRYVIVSPTAGSLRDLRNTPVRENVPGAEVNANALDNLLTGRFVRRAAPAWDAALAFALAVALAFAILGSGVVASAPLASSLASTAVAMGVIGGYVWLAFRLLLSSGTWVGIAVPVLGAALSTVASLMVKSSLERRDRRFVQEALGRYTSPQLVGELVAHPERLSLEWGELTEISVFFSDIAGFTSFSERLKPERVVALLNDYLTRMTDIVLAHGGIVDKYIGDAIMAFWGAPVSEPEHARRAVLAALAMRQACDEERPRWEREYGVTVVARAGINSGPAVVGNMGSRHKFNYTCMGDTVNLASRLEGANKPYDTRLMISEGCYERVRDVVEVRELDFLAVKGKEEPVRVYEVLAQKGGVSPDVARAVERFHEGLRLYRAQAFAEAASAFEATLAARPNDGPSRTYLERCRKFIEDPPGAGWDGVWHMKEK